MAQYCGTAHCMHFKSDSQTCTIAFTCMCARVCVCVRVCVCARVRARVSVCVCMHTCMHAHVPHDLHLLFSCLLITMLLVQSVPVLVHDANLQFRNVNLHTTHKVVLTERILVPYHYLYNTIHSERTLTTDRKCFLPSWKPGLVYHLRTREQNCVTLILSLEDYIDIQNV